MQTHKLVAKPKSLICALLFSASFMMHAETTEPVVVAAAPIMNADFEQAATNAADKAALPDTIMSSNINTQDCPHSFYSITLPQNGKLCQVFAADLPASMVFYVPQSPSEVVQYFKQQHTSPESSHALPSAAASKVSFSTSKQVKSRYLLLSDDKNTTIVISSDGEGTQVDVLVKSDSI
jgi:hypothetical protein